MRLCLFAVLLSGLLLSGCQMHPQVHQRWKQATDPWMGSPQQVSQKTVYENLAPGRSTQIDVYNLFGPPNTTFLLSDVTGRIEATRLPQFPQGTYRVWSYHRTEAFNRFALDPRPVRHQVLTAVVLFDIQGRLLDISVDERLR